MKGDFANFLLLEITFFLDAIKCRRENILPMKTIRRQNHRNPSKNLLSTH